MKNQDGFRCDHCKSLITTSEVAVSRLAANGHIVLASSQREKTVIFCGEWCFEQYQREGYKTGKRVRKLTSRKFWEHLNKLGENAI